MAKEIILGNNKGVVIVDDDAYEALNARSWSLTGNYASTWVMDPNKGRNYPIYMHRMLTNAPEGVVVDHINGDPLDNRLCNLRLATPSQNVANSRLSKNSKTGFKGVHKVKDQKRPPYLAKIVKNNKHIHLGYFHTPEEAAKAYNEAALKLFGEFARLNDVKEK